MKACIPRCLTRKLHWIVLGTVLLSGCDLVYERAGIPNQEKLEAEGKAIGSACRHAGRGLEDCYQLNKTAAKASVFLGWKEMNEYMIKNNMQTVTPTLPPEPTIPVKAKSKKNEENASEGSNAVGDSTDDSAKQSAKDSAKDSVSKSD
jgi:hypothetical protein